MRGFLTASGTTYVVNEKNRTISGGPILLPEQYSKVIAIVGCRGLIFLKNGMAYSTNIVQRYV